MMTFEVKGKSFSPAPLQRKCACGNCSACRKKMQRSAATGESAPAVPQIVYDVLRSPGQPLNAAARSYMEPRFGYDFSNVRLHTDARAAASARAVSADAYTVGKDVVFDTGLFSPQTQNGRSLLAHELTHVVQQGGQQSGGSITLGNARDTLEKEAIQTGQQITQIDSRNAPADLMRCPGRSLQRQTATPMDADVISQTEDEDEEVMDGDSPISGGSEVGEEPEKEEEGPAEAHLPPAIQFQKKKTKKADGSKAKADKPPARHITQIDVDLGGQSLTITWSDGTTTKGIPISSGKGLPNTTDDPCKDPNADNTNCTPVGTFSPGKKGGADYTNKKGDAMSWFVELRGPGADDRGIGIHDKQSVTGSPASHGCIRVPDAAAKLINKNVTKSTTIIVSGKPNTKPYKRRTRKKKPKKP